MNISRAEIFGVTNSVMFDLTDQSPQLLPQHVCKSPSDCLVEGDETKVIN